jgi:hypothetical protein
MPAKLASLIAVVVALFVEMAAAQESQPVDFPDPPEVIAALDLRISPLMDLMMYVRAMMEQDADVPDIEGLADAVAAARAAQEAMGGSTGWGIFQGPASGLDSAAEMVELCRQFPEQITTRSGVSYALREVSVSVAEGLAAAEPAFLRELWPQRRVKLEAAAADLRTQIEPRQEEIYRYVQESLNIARPQETIPLYLVLEGPWPGAQTYRARAGGRCFVALADHSGSQQLESVIHETLHVLDDSTRGESSVFNELQAAMREAGIPRNDSLRHDVPHTVMFVQAAETVRRLLDPTHVDYGETEMWGRPGLYARQPRIPAAVRPAWRAYLDGVIDRAEAVRRMVQGVVDTAD